LEYGGFVWGYSPLMLFKIVLRRAGMLYPTKQLKLAEGALGGV